MLQVKKPKGLCGAEGWRVPGKCTRAICWKARVRCWMHLNLQIHSVALFHATCTVAALITQKNKSSIQEPPCDGSQDTEGSSIRSKWLEMILILRASVISQKMKVAQSCLTLYNPMDCINHGILQARILEWVAYPFSSQSSQPRNWTGVSCISGGFFTNWTIREAWSSQLINKLQHHFFFFLKAYFVPISPSPRQNKGPLPCISVVRGSDLSQSPSYRPGITQGPLSS